MYRDSDSHLAAGTALLVVDLQEGFFEAPALRARRADLVAAVNRLAVEARGRGWPVIWIRSEYRADLRDAFAVMRRRNIRKYVKGTPSARLLAELAQRPEDLELVKKRYSAFFGTDLAQLCEEHGWQRLVIAGVNTHACVRMTAIDAYQLDFEVIVARDCVASYDQQHHEMTLRYLGRDIAEILDSRDIAALPTATDRG